MAQCGPAGSNLTINGGGFVEGGQSVNFGGVVVEDPDAGSTTVDVFSSGTQTNVTIPTNGLPIITVTTAGGVSNTLAAISDTLGVAPSVNLTSPGNGDTVFEGGAINIVAQASDDVFLVSVTFQVKDPFFDVVASFTDFGAPFEYLYFVPAGSPGQ